MKKIINGKRYDTDTAKECGFFSINPGQLDELTETLYRKSTGEFFLHGCGGPQTKYANADGLSGWSSGERILPLTVSEAKGWAEKNISADEYEKLFEVTEEDKQLVGFKLSKAAISKIAEIAATEGISKSEVVERMFQ